MKHAIGKILAGVAAVFTVGAIASAVVPSQPQINNTSNPAETLPLCDGINVTKNCQDETGTAYQTYIQHEAIPETTKEVTHPAMPAVTRTVQHPAVTGTRQVRDCIRTSISYKSGSCALSQCRDGSYSGSTGRGTCSYHGGVARSGGPWYVYTTETHVVTPAWTETITVTPAKPAWTETVVDTPAQPAYLEKVPME